MIFITHHVILYCIVITCFLSCDTLYNTYRTTSFTCGMVIRNASGKSGDDSSRLFSRVFQTSRVPHKCVSISLADQEITASQEIASCCAQSTKNCALDSDCSASAILNCSCLSHFAKAALASLLILLRDWAFRRRA